MDKVRMLCCSTCALVFFIAVLMCCDASESPAHQENADAADVKKNLLPSWPDEGPRKVWSIPIQDDKQSTHAGPCISKGKVYLPGRTGQNDVIYCIDKETGHELWKYVYAAPAKDEVYGTGIRATPTVFDGCLYTLGCFGQLLCLNAETGSVVWQCNLLADFNGRAPVFGMAAAPLVFKDMLICEPGGPGTSVVALDPKNGKEIWRSGNDEASYAAPQKVLLANTPQILAYMATGLVAFDLKSGAELWRYDYLEERRKNIPAPVVADDIVYVTNNTLGFTALKVAYENNKWTTHRLWSSRKEKQHYGSPLLGEGCLYYHNSKREIKCLDLKDGKVRWTVDNVGAQYAGLIRIDEKHLLAAADDGHIMLFEGTPQAGTEAARFQPLESSFPQPAIADGRLYVRDHKNLMCFELSVGLPAVLSKVDDKGLEHHQTMSDRIEWISIWKIYGNLFLVGGLASVVLAIIGGQIEARAQRLEGIAVCQTAAFAVIVAAWLNGLIPQSYPLFHSTRCFMLVAMSLAVAAALTLKLGTVALPGRAQSLAKWGLLIVTTILIYMLSRSELASVDVYSVLASTIIIDTRSSASEAAILAVLVVAAETVLRRSSHVLSARRSKALNILFTALYGVAIGLCVRFTGMFFSLSCLVAPALVVRTLGIASKGEMYVGPTIALGTVICSFAIAPFIHCPPAQFTALVFAVFMAIAGLAARLLPKIRSSRLTKA